MLGMALFVAVLHVWTRVSRWESLALLALCAPAVCAAAYIWLKGPARAVHDRFGRPLGAIVLGRPGFVFTAVILGLTTVLWGTGVGARRRAQADARARGRNVIIIALDTVRADRFSLLSAHERDRDLTPNMRELVAERGTVFSRAISQAPWTLPAFASIYTGLYPAEHGADQRWLSLPASQLTLAEILREVGYRTIGVVSGPYVSKGPGMDQGYEFFDESQAVGHRTISSAEVTDRAIRFLGAHRDEPFFMFTHYFDPHWVYREHDGRSFADGYRGELRGPSQNLTQNEFYDHIRAIWPQHGGLSLDPDELQFLRDLYDGEIAFTDAEIGRLLRYIREAGLDESSLIVVVGDHGDEFLERGNLWHGKTVYQELVHVPLALVHPASRTRSLITQPVETRALFTTILEFLGVPAPRDPRLPSALPPVGTVEEGPVRSATHVRISPTAMFSRPADVWWTCIQDDRWKLMKEHRRNRALLYDLKSDPGETQSCAESNPQERQRLQQKLDEIDSRVRAEAPSSAMPEVDPAMRRQLRTLGYL